MENYITLQKFKYEDRVEVFYEIPEELLECRVPNILLQPIVENALFHG
ncbi:MAG: sensor histidine kinase [Blautia marasmi]